MRRLFPLVSLGIFVVVVLVVAFTALPDGDGGGGERAEREPTQVDRKVLAISIDGLNPDALAKAIDHRVPIHV